MVLYKSSRTCERCEIGPGKKLKVTQRNMQRVMLGITLRDRVRNELIRKRTTGLEERDGQSIRVEKGWRGPTVGENALKKKKKKKKNFGNPMGNKLLGATSLRTSGTASAPRRTAPPPLSVCFKPNTHRRRVPPLPHHLPPRAPRHHYYSIWRYATLIFNIMIQKDAYLIDNIETGCKTALFKDLRLKIKMAKNFIKILNYTKDAITIVTPKMLGLKDVVFNELKMVADIERVSTRRIFLEDVGRVICNNIIPYKDIREVIIKNYLEKKTIPTMLRLKSDFEEIMMYRTNDYVKQSLKGRGFVWRKLPGTKQSIIVEDPKRVIDRHRYFNKLKEYRDEGRSIVYIEERCYSSRSGSRILDLEPVFMNTTKWYIIIATENALINTYTHMYQPTFNYITWLMDMVIPLLPNNSVIVIEDKLNWEQRETPKVNEFSSKKDIKEWLDECGVHCDPQSNKAELMILVNKFTEERSMKLNDFFKGHGHDVLRRQRGFPNLCFTAPILKLFQKTSKNANLQGKELMDIIKSVTEEQWKEMNECVKKEEKKVYEEDILLDEVIDKIVAMAAETGVLNEELDIYQHDTEYYVFAKDNLCT
ncbi:hypothetical protein MSG28_011427 [Choristoneura fumiferana]|uniref:Uncharacterized protein n=1 Tax=Choristoneura fumiferana TaxID=7141 RepID=A0ACC0JN71_CHOFU|nr:hypothetical protein MSG28_011427 [Choristoneura fumiferana]